MAGVLAVVPVLAVAMAVETALEPERAQAFPATAKTMAVATGLAVAPRTPAATAIVTERVVVLEGGMGRALVNLLDDDVSTSTR